MLKRGLRHLARGYLTLREFALPRPRRFVWILSHMRAGSSLLHHLLISHPSFLGCGERNAAYRMPRDLDRSAVDMYYRRRQLWTRSPGFVDQINHTRFVPDRSVLQDSRLQVIFLLRRPDHAIASMADVLGRHYGMTGTQAAEYYLERVPALAADAESLDDPERAFGLTYEDLIDNTAAALEDLSHFLGLAQPLTDHYRTFTFTGKSGDPSPRIQAGRIVASEPRRLPPLDSALWEEAETVYLEARSRLWRCCQSPARPLNLGPENNE